MAHSAQPPTPPRRSLEVLVGAVLLVAGIAAVIVALIAMRHPKGREAGVVDTSTITSTATSATDATKPPTSAVTTPPSTQTSTSAPRSSTGTGTPSVTTSVPKTSTSSTVPAGVRLPLTVLNSTGNDAATASAVARFTAGGWATTNGGFFEGEIISTAAYYDPDADGSKAAALALQKQFPAIKRVVPRFSGLPSGPVVVVLTSDYS